MKLLRWKVWSPWDIACLKWCCLLLGMIVGAWLADFTRAHTVPLAVAAALLATRAAFVYFRDDG